MPRSLTDANVFACLTDVAWTYQLWRLRQYSIRSHRSFFSKESREVMSECSIEMTRTHLFIWLLTTTSWTLVDTYSQSRTVMNRTGCVLGYMDQLLLFLRMLQQRERIKRSEDSRCHQNSWVTRKAWQPVVQVSQVNLKQTNSNLPWMCSWTKREKRWISKRHGFHNYKPL